MVSAIFACAFPPFMNGACLAIGRDFCGTAFWACECRRAAKKATADGF